MTFLQTMATVNCVLLLAACGLLVGLLRVKRETRDLLRVIKAWAFSAKSHHSDALRIMEKVGEEPSRETILQKVEAVPEQTAEKVVEKLQGDG